LKRRGLLADPQKVLDVWKNFFCQLLNVHGAGGVRQTEMNSAEPSVPERSAFKVKGAAGKLGYEKVAVFWVVAPGRLV
jgi:hypothetical protein